MNGLREGYDIESDVVVVGYGAAGAVAAITAHDNGAGVLLLEKMPNGGGNSRVCGGNIIVPQSMEFAKYLKTLSFGTTEPEIIERFVTDAMKNGIQVPTSQSRSHLDNIQSLFCTCSSVSPVIRVHPCQNHRLCKASFQKSRTRRG